MPPPVGASRQHLSRFQIRLAISWLDVTNWGGDGKIHLRPRELPGAPRIVFCRLAQLEGPGNALHHIGIRVDDLDVFSAGLERAGVEFTKKPGPGAVGIRTAFIKAPDGVLIELADESPG